MSRRLPSLGKRAGERQVDQFRASKGSAANKLLGRPIFILDVVGRSSGQPRPVALMLARRGDDLLVTGSNGGNPKTPNWYENLRAAGEAHVEVGSDRWAVDFRELPEGAEREECWKLLVQAYPDFDSYRELTERRLPVGVLSRKSS